MVGASEKQQFVNDLIGKMIGMWFYCEEWGLKSHRKNDLGPLECLILALKLRGEVGEGVWTPFVLFFFFEEDEAE
ncbi:hypothetical protein Tco_1393382 [Tanacetum coccineum]